MVAAVNEMLTGSAGAVADLIRRRELSSAELTRLVLDRIDAVNPELNAVVELRREAALREAAAADEAIARGEQAGPLHGVPMTVKEAFQVTGLHSTWGNAAFRDFIASRDAAVVRRLREAGAVITGTTNVAFMLGDFAQTANDLYGVTSNPWDTSRVPGGSSGGSAAAVAAGMSFLEYGSDMAGSIRIPAAFCGVYGLKPSAGIVPPRLSAARAAGAAPGPACHAWPGTAGQDSRRPADRAHQHGGPGRASGASLHLAARTAAAPGTGRLPGRAGA